MTPNLVLKTQGTYCSFNLLISFQSGSGKYRMFNVLSLSIYIYILYRLRILRKWLCYPPAHPAIHFLLCSHAHLRSHTYLHMPKSTTTDLHLLWDVHTHTHTLGNKDHRSHANAQPQTTTGQGKLHKRGRWRLRVRVPCWSMFSFFRELEWGPTLLFARSHM